MTIPEQSADDVRQILDSIPERDWQVAVWLPSQNYVSGRMDVADRRRIVENILRLIDGVDDER